MTSISWTRHSWWKWKKNSEQLFAAVACTLLLSCQGTAAQEESPVARHHKEVVCLVYHRFGDSRFPSTNVTLRDFEAHLTYLKKEGFRVLPFSEALRYLNDDTPAAKTVAITIDDGYKTFYKNALPLLSKFGMPATLFINTETVGGNDYMDWSELKEAVAHGIEIGNHTHSHAYFLNLADASRYNEFRRELKLSQEIIGEHLGLSPEVFAYPYGEFDDTMKSMVEDFGFIGAAAQNSGVMSNDADLYRCPRFPMSESYSDMKQFAEKINMRRLRTLNETPASFLLPKNEQRPELSVTLTPGQQINVRQMQCYVQGSACKISLKKDREGNDVVVAYPDQPIGGRRRTLYTLTVRDSTGAWHWLSHLWINPTVN
ncbi:MAG: polysaccharide deacetylase family protein [Bacteroidia bacterium]|nr:polysaccharide deacetylase family protein [Bacteroidia bacterium]